MAKLPAPTPGGMPLPPKWDGWRFTESGQYLVSPTGDRITVERLKGLLWRDQMELMRDGFTSRRMAEQNRSSRQLVKVVVVQLSDYRDGLVRSAG